MKYATPEAFRAALDQRIRNEAATSGVTVMRLRKRLAFERFLARLAVVDPQRWVLKPPFACGTNKPRFLRSKQKRQTLA